MISYCDLSVISQGLILFSAFAVSCSNLLLLTRLLKEKKLLPKCLSAVCLLTSLGLLVFCICATKSARFTASKPAPLEPLISADHLLAQGGLNSTEGEFWDFPAVWAITSITIAAFISVWLWSKSIRDSKHTLSTASIKEGFDALDAGLCFSCIDGQIVLINHCMKQLCGAIAGFLPENSDSFWKALTEGNHSLEVTVLSRGSSPSFRLADGTVWTFKRERVGSFIQIIATNTTQIFVINENLKNKNIELSALNFRLRKYGENVNELTRSKERLETKAQIHSELGRALMATRRFLLDSTPERIPPLDLWKRNIKMLRSGIDSPDAETPLEILKRVADLSGVKVSIQGTLPNCKRTEKIFVEAATESLTNAVIHGKAKTLYINFEETDKNYTARFTNDGSAPKGEITEGGGLNSLRKKAQRLDGEMIVGHKGGYTLTITIPKGRGDEF